MTARPDAHDWAYCRRWLDAECGRALDALRAFWRPQCPAVPVWLYYRHGTTDRDGFGALGFYVDAPDSSWRLAEPGAYRGSESWARIEYRLRETARQLPVYPAY